MPVYARIASLGPALVRQTRSRRAATPECWTTVSDPCPRICSSAHGLPAAGRGSRPAPRTRHRTPTVEELAAAISPRTAGWSTARCFGLQVELALAREGFRPWRSDIATRRTGAVRERVTAGLPFRLTGPRRRCWTRSSEDLDEHVADDAGCCRVTSAAARPWSPGSRWRRRPRAACRPR